MSKRLLNIDNGFLQNYIQLMQAIENTYKIKYCGISGGFGMIYAIGI
jgi:hypothetical protein